jgi:16S rRNA A1518/A1519 N6-dimethyltransferase RsmA/KsgA/DIM1 with predicted DNA glycosylase/AP lyase activity
MMWLYLVATVVVGCFAYVTLFGAPYVPTLNKQVDASLKLLDLAPGQTLIELGSGDGKVMLAAAKRGLNVVGYELNPILVAISIVRTWHYRRQIKVIWGDYWRASWPITDGIFAFILPKYMAKLNKKVIQECKSSVKVVSFAFEIPDKKPSAHLDGVWLYRY